MCVVFKNKPNEPNTIAIIIAIIIIVKNNNKQKYD